MAKEAKLVNITSKSEREKTWRSESCSRTMTVSGFLWNQELRRKMVKEVADVMEVRNGLLANALVYPMVRFSLMNDREGRRRMVLNILEGGFFS